MKEIDALRAENQRLERDLEMMYEHDRDHSAEIGRLKAELESAPADERWLVVSHGLFIRFFLFDSLLGERFVPPM